MTSQGMILLDLGDHSWPPPWDQMVIEFQRVIDEIESDRMTICRDSEGGWTYVGYHFLSLNWI